MPTTYHYACFPSFNTSISECNSPVELLSVGETKPVTYDSLLGYRFDVITSGNVVYSGTNSPYPLVSAPHVVWRAKSPKPSEPVTYTVSSFRSVQHSSTPVQNNFDSLEFISINDGAVTKPTFIIFPKIGNGQFDNPFLDGFNSSIPIYKGFTFAPTKESYNAISEDHEFNHF
ncbi:MAG: hypothetical protein AAGG51_07340 [Cyanobacteria bacterium P01_G01_bin.54]